MKKFLSLVLALVMTMSLVTISAGAKDFADDSSIKYDEAVDVMSAVDVISGYPDGSFQPTTLLTRGAAAKIICNLILGPTTASALGADTAPYSDVPTTNTFAGYIAYCQKEGIISGYADGTFRPAAPLTGYAFMKMLLGALGYDASKEGYVGANWSINVAKQAINLGLDDGNDDFTGAAYVNREEAMLYAFNTLNATMVTYGNDTTVTVGDITVSQSGKATPETCVKGAGNDGNIKEDGYVQFAEMYFPNLKKVAGDTDAFNRPATTWKVKSETVGTYTDEADATYTAEVKLGTIYTDLGLSKGIPAANVTHYVNGAYAGAFTNNILKGDVTNRLGGNGVLTEVFYDADNNSVVISEVYTYVGKIASVVSASTTKDAYVTLATSPKTGPGSEFETEGFAKDDIVLYTFSAKSSENCIESMVKAEAVTGVMSKFVDSKSVTVANTTYEQSFQGVNITGYTTDLDKEVTVYLDEYGYAAYVDANTTVNFAVLLAYEPGNSLDSPRAKLLFTDGTTKVVNLKSSLAGAVVGLDGSLSTYASIQAGNGAFSQFDIVSYTVNSKDEYTLTLAADARDARNNATLVTNGISSFSGVSGNAYDRFVNGVKTARSGLLYNNGKTIFLIRNTVGGKETFSVYEGIANVPTITTTSGTAPAITVLSTNDVNAKIVFLDVNYTVTLSNQNKDVTFIKGDATLQSHTSALGTYWEYPAVVNGEVTTIKTDSQVNQYTLVSGVSYDENGIATGWNASASNNRVVGGMSVSTTGTGVYSGQGTESVTNDVVKLAGTWYAYTDDCQVFYISTTGEVRASTISAIGDDANDFVWFKLTDGQVSNVFVQVVDSTVNNVGSTAGVAAIGATGGANVLYVNLQTNSAVTTTEDIKGTVTISVLNGGTWVKVRDVEITIPTGTSANAWGTQVTVSGLLAGQYKVECGNLTPQFAVVSST